MTLTEYTLHFGALRFGSKNAYWLQFQIGCFKGTISADYSQNKTKCFASFDFCNICIPLLPSVLAVKGLVHCHQVTGGFPWSQN